MALLMAAGVSSATPRAPCASHGVRWARSDVSGAPNSIRVVRAGSARTTRDLDRLREGRMSRGRSGMHE